MRVAERRPSLALAALALAASVGLGCNEAARPSETARNLVVISLDTLRADHLGVYGYARGTSPQLDAWAAEAFVFERATSTANATQGAHHALFQSRPASAAMAGKHSAPTLAAILRERGFRTAGYTDGGTMAASLGFARGFEHYDDGNRGLADSVPEALAWLDEVAAGEAPFYLLVHTFDVHLPYDPPPPYDTRFEPKTHSRVTGRTTLPLLRGVRQILTETHRETPVKLGPKGRRRVVALYDGEIAKTDALLAPLLARLDAPDLQGDTLVVVLSDHGEEFWDHGSVLHSHTLYEELLRVPLLMRVPGWRDRVRRVPERVSMLDVLPTLLELLGVPPPGGLRGRSLAPLLRGETRAPAPVLAEGYPFASRLQSVTDGRFKLIRSLETGTVELYDLEVDPRERNDLAAVKPARIAPLAAVLDAELPSTASGSADPIERPDTLDAATQQRLRELGYID